MENNTLTGTIKSFYKLEYPHNTYKVWITKTKTDEEDEKEIFIFCNSNLLKGEKFKTGLSIAVKIDARVSNETDTPRIELHAIEIEIMNRGENI